MSNAGRNAPCPCGSGKKHKQCCLQQKHASPHNHAGNPASVTGLLQAAFNLHQAGQLRRAEAMYRDVLRISPDHPDALHLLGLMSRQEGNNELAVVLISKAARLNPVAPVFFNLGNSYQALGELDEAVNSFQRALALNPNYIAAMNNMGIAFQHQGKLKNAIDTFHKALALQPDHAELYSNLGDALRENRQFEAAIECIQRAITLKPDFSNAYFCLGKTLHDRGQPHEALSNFQRALALNPKHADTHMAMANTYASEGKFSSAREHIEQALQIDPDNPAASASIAFSRKMTPEDQPWSGKAQKLLNGHLKPKEKIHLNYALGKYFDDTCQYDRAFFYYAAANGEQKNMQGRFDRDAHRHMIDSIIAANPKEKAHQETDGASHSERPAFIVGMPRSGTSLVEQILASHHDVHGAGELHFWGMEALDYPPDNPAWRNDPDHLEKTAVAYVAEMTRHSPTALRVVDKMPANFLHLGMIHSVFPKARIIHMQRNPADTCLSIYFQGFSEQHPYANDLDDLAFYYREYNRLMKHWRNILPPDVFLEVPYEGLIEDQEHWSRRVIDFIGLAWDDRCLNFHETARRVGTASNWQVRQAIYKTSKARWMNYQQFIEPLLSLLD